MKETYQQIKNEIENHNIKEALTLFNSVVNNKYANDYIVIQSRYSNWKQREIRGFAPENNELNKIIFDLLELVEINFQEDTNIDNLKQKENRSIDDICQMTIFRPFERPFSSIGFEIYFDNQLYGEIMPNKEFVINTRLGEHTLKISYSKYIDKRVRDGFIECHYYAESDVLRFSINKEKIKFRCGFRHLEKTFFGLLVMDAGHKIYIEEVT